MCRAAIQARSDAWWETDTKTLRCPQCGDPEAEAAITGGGEGTIVRSSNPPADASPAVESDLSLHAGAGSSADREGRRRLAKREAAIRSRHPRVGGLILALSDDPQSTKAWLQGAEGERRVGAALDAIGHAGVVALHDRRVPGSRANIDHIAIAPSGVWVIDAKRYSGQVAKKDVGGWFTADERLYVGRRDCTKLVVAMAKQVEVVRQALGDDLPGVPVHPLLCFVGAEWGWFAKPFVLQGVTVAWPSAAAGLVSSSGPYLPDAVELMALRLGNTLVQA
ncbi:MAG: hypothetical protein JWO37_1877 [Acidimicrobiales bacterium]|jgi:hypothetical protein|nr:hypothetical protein [Acidimicrobiales bacterium]